MAGDRRAARLRVAWTVAASSVAAAAVIVPLREHAILPTPAVLGVGWSFLAASLLAFRRGQVAACLGLGGILWVLVGLAPWAPFSLEEPLARLALAPTALLVCASAGLSARHDRRLTLLACTLALTMGVVGGAGAPRFALLGIALVALAVPATATARPTGTTVVQAGVGAGLLVVALNAAAVVPLSADLTTAFHLLVLAGSAVAIGWTAALGVRLGAGLVSEAPSELGRALGRALGTGEVTVLFPGGDGGWLDPQGRPIEPDATSYDVTDTAGTVLARTTPALIVERGLTSDLNRFLRVAGDGARLRAGLRARADELARSRVRLVSAAEDERRRLVSLLEAGPVLRLTRLGEELGARACVSDWTARISAARQTLDALVGGLDPVDISGGLRPALARLTDASGGRLLVTGSVPDDLDPAVARVLWFACAEALANVRKHATDSAVEVTLEAAGDDIVLTVTDDGPGGADRDGAGLAGLADRLALAGGCLDVCSDTSGTTLVARVPFAGDVLPLMPGPVELAKVDP